MTHQQFQHIASTIPQEPGIYKYFDGGKELLYVGKAKNLRKRVGSYFSKTFSTYKTYELVQRIDRIECTLVNSEQDAFLLENALIKQFQPRFNISLKDDKSYPFIVIKKEPFPRVFLTRRRIQDGSTYLGPFTSVAKVRELMDFVRSNIQLRTCKLNLTEQNIRKKKFKVCLEYHLGNCKGPCEGLQSAQDYALALNQVKNVLGGNLGEVIQDFKKEMKAVAANMEFEKAELLRKRIEHLETYRARSVIVSKRIGNADVFTMVRVGERSFVNYLMLQHGTIVQTHSTMVETPLEETPEDILVFTISTLRERFGSKALEIIVPIKIEYPQPGVFVCAPKGGEKRKLIELSLKNASYYRQEMERKDALHLSAKTPEEHQKALYDLMEDLQLPLLPVHIECFDNSNFQGSYPVSAMVCFKDGVESKADYRRFNVKTVKGINDFATMTEVVLRRFKRLQEEKKSLPQLVIIDGGKGQLSAALEAIEQLGLTGSMTLVGLAKQTEEIFFAGDKESLKLPYQSESLKMIRRIRDEVHRFGIQFHRQKRSKGTFTNELEKIQGIGKKTADLLLKTFRSVIQVRGRSEAELAAVVGLSKAKLVKAHFDKGAEPGRAVEDIK